MNFKLLLGIFVPLIVAVALVILSSMDIGFSVEVETEKSVQFNSLFTYKNNPKDNVLIQTITITNDFFLPRKFELSRLIVCWNVKNGFGRRADMQVRYSEGKYTRDSDIPLFQDLFYDPYTYYSSTQSIEIPANGKKQLKVLVMPKYTYSNEIISYKDYDELLLIQSKEKRRYYYNLCQDLDSKELGNAVHIDIVNKSIEQKSSTFVAFVKSAANDNGSVVECKDSDGGKDYYLKGTVEGDLSRAGGKYNGVIGRATDFCLQLKNGTYPWEYNPKWDSEDVLANQYMYSSCEKDCAIYEMFCDNGIVLGVALQCPAGCKDGACIGERG